jgi:thiol-disulfide isomerase/thioredoxin
MFRLLLLALLFIHSEGKTQSRPSGILGVEIKTIKGKKFAFNNDQDLCVVVFLSTSCPLSQKYTLTLNELSKEFNGKVKLYGVFADAEPIRKEYQAFKKKYNINFELLVDKHKQLVRSLTASITPEAFLLHKGNVLYHGAIDDWAIELGKTKKSASVNFVRNAIHNAMANKEIIPAYSKPVGCFIE